MGGGRAKAIGCRGDESLQAGNSRNRGRITENAIHVKCGVNGSFHPEFPTWP